MAFRYNPETGQWEYIDDAESTESSWQVDESGRFSSGVDWKAERQKYDEEESARKEAERIAEEQRIAEERAKDERAARKAGISYEEYKEEGRRRTEGNVFEKLFQGIKDTWRDLRQNTTPIQEEEEDKVQLGDLTLNRKNYKDEVSNDQFIQDYLLAENSSKWIEDRLVRLRELQDLRKRYNDVSYIPGTIQLKDTSTNEARVAIQEEKNKLLEGLSEKEKGLIDEYRGDPDKLKFENKVFKTATDPLTSDLENEISKLEEVQRVMQQVMGMSDIERDIIAGIRNSLDSVEERQAKIPFLGTASEVDTLLKTKEVLEKAQNGEELDEFEKTYLVMAQAKFMKQRLDLGYGNNIGEGLTNLAAFGVEIAAGGGVSSAAKAGGREVLGEMTETAIGQLIITSIGLTARGSVNVLPRATQEYYEKAIPQFAYVNSEEGKTTLELLDGDESFDNAWRSVAGQTVEVATELLGGKLIEGSGDFLKKLVLGKATEKVSANIIREGGEATAANISKVLRSMGYQGIIAEALEEELGEPFQAAIDQREYQAPILTREGTARFLQSTIISAVPGAAVSTLEMASNAGQSYQVEAYIDEDNQLVLDTKNKTQTVRSTDKIAENPYKDVPVGEVADVQSSEGTQTDPLIQKIQENPEQWDSLLKIADESKDYTEFQEKVQSAVEAGQIELPQEVQASSGETRFKDNVPQELIDKASEFDNAEEFFLRMDKDTRESLRSLDIKSQEAQKNFWEHYANQKEPILDNLNPTGNVLAEYDPESRMKMKLGKNITTLDKTMKVDPSETITIYRGAPKSQTEINPGDFITTNYELAKSYSGEGNVISREVKASEILDDKSEPLGEQYIYRPDDAKYRTQTIKLPLSVMREFADFIDYVRGQWSPKNQFEYEASIRDLAAEYGINSEQPNARLANRLSSLLDQNEYGKKIKKGFKDTGRLNSDRVIKTAKYRLEVDKDLEPRLTAGKNKYRDYDTGLVARERFDIPNLEKISSGGSDRDVYNLGDDAVLKVAKTARGLAQNAIEADYFASEQGLIPKTLEVGKNYVVVEKVGKPDANTKAMLKALDKEVGWLSKRDYEKIEKAVSIMEEYGYAGEQLRNYDPLWGDILALRNWGTLDGKPIHIDGGSLSDGFIEEYRGTKNLDDPEFREAYYQSKDAKRKYGDTDKITKYREQLDEQFKGGVTQAEVMDIIEFNRRVFNDGKIGVVESILTPDGAKALGKYINGWIDLAEGQTDIVGTYYHEAVHKAIDLFLPEERKQAIFDYAEQQYRLTGLAAEERIAEDFIAFARGEDLSIPQRIRQFFEDLLNFMRGFSKNTNEIRSFYQDLIDGRLKENSPMLNITEDLFNTLKEVNRLKNLTITQQQDEPNQENQATATSQQDQEGSQKATKETVWETAITQKESLRGKIDEGEEVVLDFVEEERGHIFEESAMRALGELETAQAGFRYVTEGADGFPEWKGQSSSFPKWFSLRTRVEIDDFLLKLPEDPKQWTLENNPFREGTRKAEAWGEFVKQLDLRNHTDILEENRPAIEEMLGYPLEQLTEKLSGLVQQPEIVPQNEAIVTQEAQIVKKPTSRQAAQEPIAQGQNKLRNSRVYEKLLETVDADLQNQPQYERMNIRENLDRAINFVENNYSKAKKVALGLENPPANITEIAIRRAMAAKALMDGDTALYEQLIRSRSLRLTRLGQEIVSERGAVDQDNPEFYIQELSNRRMDMAVKKLPEAEGSTDRNVIRKILNNDKTTTKERVNSYVDKEVKNVKKILDVENIKIAKAQEIIDLLTC